MQPIKITIQGIPIIKKNTSKTSLYYKDKLGRRIPRDQPVHYYSPEYTKWAKIAIQTCAVFKTKNPNIQFPLTDKINVKCLFWMPNQRSIDLSNLFAGVHDVLAGKAGIDNIPSHIYQIISDDSSRYIGSVDGSRVLLDMLNPRIDVTISDFIL